MDGMGNGGHAGHAMTTTDNPHSGHGMPAGGMKMFFHTGFNEVVLFQQWSIQSVGAMVGSCVGIFFIAALYEGLKVLREYLLRRYIISVQYPQHPGIPLNNSNSGSGASSSEAMVQQNNSAVLQKMCTCPHFIQTLLHVVQVTVSYFLMLIFMTYNVWLCLAVLLGAGTGYFVFGWKKAVVVDINEHCH